MRMGRYRAHQELISLVIFISLIHEDISKVLLMVILLVQLQLMRGGISLIHMEILTT
ncbi:hypothetical protein C8J23_12011 [Shewanella chilikensis]|uniref:Uncharacterized protein n=1 Tax=Shewanella chilikensis TaxID=558541 RepID=A0ABX5PLS0_9GAMM|nr:hypothetical protein C8J23_1203 [Shewanella chilikensis]PYE57561.1 hypothetical protein C8J23_12011 [Shewanella chilikensis]